MHLYIIQSNVTGAIKIGRSKNVEKRLKQLQTGCPYRLRLLLKLPNKSHLEKSLHQQLQEHKLTKTRTGLTFVGEWFSVECLPDLPVWIYEQLDLENLDWWQESFVNTSTDSFII